jgi:hypothetical protein
MTPPAPQRPANAPSRERPAASVRPAFVATWRSVDPTSPVTPYDEIWFQGRPQLP